MIEYQNVCKAFDDVEVLENVSCVIPDHKTTVIIGPSGVGKSVMMKMIIGLEAPDSGQVLVGGLDVARLDRSGLYRLREKMGMLFQGGALFDSMTVGENVAFPIRMHTSKPEGEILSIVSEKLSLVGMPGTEDKWPSELSGGMRKRVGLARAIALEPDIVLFDEPTSGLDPIIADSIDNLIISMQEKLKCTFVVISHDIPGTFKIADMIGVLYDTKLVAYGNKEDMMHSANPLLRDFFARNKLNA
jgi:phospholipid/cholesterol/gamma-HCH transport system ATP-binding protein